MTPAPKPAPDTHALSYRDEEIVLLYRAGLTEDAIARRLGHTPPTVRGALLAAMRAGVSVMRRAAA